MYDKVKQELLNFNRSFTEEELALGTPFFKKKTFKAKELIVEAGKVADFLFYADSSITRCFYSDQEGNEHTLWMKPEQTFIAEYKSFVSGEPSQFSLQFYEPTQVYVVAKKDLHALYAKHTNWAMFGIHLTERVHVTLIDVFVNLLANDATRNYQYIEYMFPRFIQVAPLKDIASMLQITQVTLSRIRSGSQLKK